MPSAHYTYPARTWRVTVLLNNGRQQTLTYNLPHSGQARQTALKKNDVVQVLTVTEAPPTPTTPAT